MAKQTISDKVGGTVEKWSGRWGNRLRAWMSNFLAIGVEQGMDIIGKAASSKLKPLVNTINATGKVPKELKPLLDELESPTGEVAALFGSAAGNALIGGAIGRIADALLLPLAYAINIATQSGRLGAPQYTALWMRDYLNDKDFETYLMEQGLNPKEINNLRLLAQSRLDANTVSQLWLRDKGKYNYLWKDLKDSGVTPDRVEAIQELTKIIPDINALIVMAVKEAFTPEIAQKFGQYEDFPEAMVEWAEKHGLSREWAERYWAAHWNLPSAGQGFDMYHRGIVSEDELKMLLRALDVMPFWRDKQVNLAWDLPNRIELRMMARYGLVDKAFLVDMLKKVGLHPDYRDVAADMMLVMGIQTDLSARYRNGYLDEDTLKSEMVAAGLSPQIQDRLFKWIVKNNKTERVAPERELTKAEIVKGVKTEKISPALGLELLMDMGYDEWEAEYILVINVEALSGSPEVYQEFKKLTQLYRQSQGMEANIPSQDLIQAEKDVKTAEQALKQVQSGERTNLTESDAKRAVDEAKLRHHQLLQSSKPK